MSGSNNWIIENLQKALNTWNEKLAEIYDVEVSTIYNQKKNLVRILSMYLFPEESAERILNN